jgi:hypothetical protein
MFAAVGQTAQQHGTSDLRLYKPILRLYIACICLFAYVLPICGLYPSIGAYAACFLTHFAVALWGQRWPDCRCANYALGMVFSLDSVVFLGLGSNSYNKFGKARERQGRRIV